MSKQDEIPCIVIDYRCPICGTVQCFEDEIVICECFGRGEE